MLSLLLLLPSYADIPPTPRPVPAAPVAAPAPPSAHLFAPTEVKTAAGLKVSVDLRDEYLAGFPVLVTVTVRNESNAPQSFPDLGTRPFLTHFLLASSKGYKQDRFNTPPPVDPGNTWTIPPGGQRQVLLELPSSTTLQTGNWTLSLEIRDPSGTVGFPTRSIRIATPRPVAGEFDYDPAVATTSGSALAFLHQAERGFDLYLATFTALRPTRIVGPYPLAHLEQKVTPYLSRTRTSDANSRYVYWQSDPSTITVLRLDGYTARSQPRSYTLPYPKVEPLTYGVTDGLGGFQLPIWVPAPKGGGGSMKVMGIDPRGNLVLRTGADLATRPSVMHTGLDGGGNLLFALSQSAGVDLYRVDPTWPAELPARGTRIWKAEGGYSAQALTLDVLPDQPDRPGGLAMHILLLGTVDGVRNYRRLHTDLFGKILVDGGIHPWTNPGLLVDYLSIGPGGFFALGASLSSRSPTNYWYSSEKGDPVRLPFHVGGEMWQDKEGVKLRRVGGPNIVEDVMIAPATTP